MRKTGAHTEKAQTAGSKQKGAQFLRPGQPSTLGKASASRVFTREYEKVPDADDAASKDTVSPFVGNPLNF